MYAIIHAGGKQYRVHKGDRIQVEKVDGNPGDTVKIQDVLLVADGDDVKIGTPVVEGAQVSGQILEQDRHRKVVSYRYLRRKDSKRKIGHRQPFTAIEITDIQA